MLPELKIALRVVALVGSLSSIASFALGPSGPTAQPAATGLWVVVLLSFVAIGLLSADTLPSRFLGKSAYKRIKKYASRSISIAAGDCSWLPDELDVLLERLQHVKVRLLWSGTADAHVIGAVERIAAQPNADVRKYVGERQVPYLRCIFIDPDERSTRAMVVTEKKIGPGALLRLVAVGRGFDRRAMEVPGDHWLFELLRKYFDDAFSIAAPERQENR